MSASDLVLSLQTKVQNFNTTVDTKKSIIDAKNTTSQTALTTALSNRQSTIDASNTAKASLDQAYDNTRSILANTTQQDLSEIIATKTDNAVDVFIYDTSKDSDGGAWRHRCTKTSWYNEPLNTAARGGRRGFPAVAVIVAEAGKVTIYDGDDPALSMWMVFDTDNPSMLASSAAPTLTSIVMRDGEMVVGSGYVYGGVSRIQFPADTAYRHRSIPSYNNTQGKWMLGGIANRNQNGGFNDDRDDAARIVNETINDVALTVLPDAPIDPTTGLPVPTIAVATDGGVSVIKDDGGVFDSMSSAAGYEIYDVSFDAEGNLYAKHSYNSSGDIATLNVYYSDIYPSAVDRLTGRTNGDVNFGFGGVSYPSITGNIFSTTTQSIVDVLETGLLEVAAAALQPIKGLSRLKISRTAPTDGSMVAYTTSTYNTGWMPGDIKGAFLSDTDDANLVASGELVTNGTFDSDTDWIKGTGWTISGGVASASTVNHPAFLVQSGAGLVEGAIYAVEVTISNYVGGTFTVQLGAAGEFDRVSGNGTYTLYGPALSVSTADEIRLRGFSNATFDVNSISIKVADADRSVNNNGFVINGTVTRSPVATGTDLVAYGPFPTLSDYVSQPHNTDLDFGTGDFSVICWVEWTTSGDIQIPLGKNELGTNIPPYFEIQINRGGSIAKWVNSAGDTAVSFGTLTSGIWTQLVYTRKNGVGTTYLNGNFVESKADTNNYDHNGKDNLFIGRRGEGYPCTHTRLSLLRISATASSPEQIKKIYEDEKFLFQENAQATLYGSSDAVTALAHDPDTDLLHVGTSAGRSTFKGLRRVENTTTAVTTAISAKNGMVIEQ